MFRWAIAAALPLASLAMPATPGAPAIAEEAAPPAAVAPDDTIWQFGRHEKLCIEWTDDCRQCRRAETDAISCSNIGIACQPKEIRCTLRKTEK
jgi:hypothetical protein